MTPILFSFRRCPYAMRARLALVAAGQQVDLREIVLRDKAPAFLAVSPSATVPCLQTANSIIDESLDVMIWALSRNDPLRWMDMPDAGWDWIERADGPFKDALDRTKYASRYPESDAREHRDIAALFLTDLDKQITDWIFERPTIADYAI
jgi:glutathione S-transferase